MKTTTISLPEARGIIYQSFDYPAGETQVRLLELDWFKGVDEVHVIAKLKSAHDIIELALLCDALYGLEVPTIQLILPYYPYARADRRFVPGDCLGVGVFAKLIESMRTNTIITLDVHSTKAEEELPLYSVFRDVSPLPLIEQAIVKFARMYERDRICVLFPDTGARNRYRIDDLVGCNVEAVRVKKLYASKQRDPVTGKFLGFEVPKVEEFEGLPILIVDDICDGGGTFIGIAELLGRKSILGLYVTHGIFSQGVEVLTDLDSQGISRDRMVAFKRIYTSNSYYTGSHPQVEVLDAGPLLMRALATARWCQQ